ncbi:MAG: PAS domain S-box protein [Candidatus Zixiibacteriota bacterium]
MVIDLITLFNSGVRFVSKPLLIIVAPTKTEHVSSWEGVITYLRDLSYAYHDEILAAAFLAAVGLLIVNHYRVKGRQALRESEARFRVLAERSMVGISVVQDGVCRYINPKLCEMLGYTESEIVDRLGPLDFAHPEERESLRRKMSERLKGTLAYANYELRILTKKGEERVVDVYGSRMIYRGRAAIMATLLDITERKRTEVALKEAHSDLNQIFNSAAPLYVVRSDRTILRVNDTYCSYLGVRPGEIVGEKCHDVWGGAICETSHCPLAVVLAGEEYCSYEREYIHQDGRISILSATALPYRGLDGSVQGVIASFADITELKHREEALRQSEERARTIYKSVPIPTYIWQWVDDEFVLKDYNDAAFELTHGKIPELLEIKFRELHPGHEDWRDDMLRCLREKTSKKYEEPVEHTLRSTSQRLFLSVSIAYVPPDYVMVHTEDVTERAQAEEALRQSERRFREMAEKAPVGIYLINESGVAYTNPAVEEMIGYSVKEIMSHPNPVELVHPEDRHIAAGNLAAFLSGAGGVVKYEVRLMGKSGNIKNLEISSSATIYQGRPMIIGTVVDITERKLAENSLKESEDRFRALAEQSPVGVFVLNGDKFEYVNPKVAQILGYTAEELQAMPSSHGHIHPEDRPAAVDLLKHIITSDVQTMSTSFRVITKNKEIRHVEAQLSKMSYQQMPGLVGTIFDVTDRILAEEALQESEKNFRTLAETSAASIIIYDLDRVVYSNPATSVITEYSAEELSGIRAWELAQAEYREVLRQKAVDRLSGTDTGFDSYEIPIITKSGKQGWVLYTGGLIQYNGKPAVLGTAIDITERKRAEAGLMAAQQERYDQVKQIAGGVAHEIYNALFPASSTLDKLRERLTLKATDDNGRDLKLVGLAETSVSRAIEMTELVTQFSRLDHERDIHMLELKSLITELILDRDKIERLGITVNIDIADDIYIRMNRIHAHSLFRNIIYNAVDALEDVSQRRIDVIARRDGDEIRVEISDTGPGIEPRIQEKIFSPFFSTKPGTGSGLGLAICRRIVDIYNGEISVVSNLDKGATFSILLRT